MITRRPWHNDGCRKVLSDMWYACQALNGLGLVFHVRVQNIPPVPSSSGPWTPPSNLRLQYGAETVSQAPGSVPSTRAGTQFPLGNSTTRHMHSTPSQSQETRHPQRGSTEWARIPSLQRQRHRRRCLWWSPKSQRRSLSSLTFLSSGEGFPIGRGRRILRSSSIWSWYHFRHRGSSRRVQWRSQSCSTRQRCMLLTRHLEGADRLCMCNRVSLLCFSRIGGKLTILGYRPVTKGRDTNLKIRVNMPDLLFIPTNAIAFLWDEIRPDELPVPARLELAYQGGCRIRPYVHGDQAYRKVSSDVNLAKILGDGIGFVAVPVNGRRRRTFFDEAGLERFVWSAVREGYDKEDPFALLL